MSGEAGNPLTGLEIGSTLKRAREKRGLSLQQVEEATKIRSRYLRDLENENFDVLPAVYVLGSLKTYAEHLGLDGAAMTRELKRRQAPLQQAQDQAQKILRRASRLDSWAVSLASPGRWKTKPARWHPFTDPACT